MKPLDKWFMKKIYKWIYALIFAVSLYSCIRWVTDYTKEGHYWTQSLGNSILEIVILIFVSYLFFIYFGSQIEKNRIGGNLFGDRMECLSYLLYWV